MIGQFGTKPSKEIEECERGKREQRNSNLAELDWSALYVSILGLGN